MYAYTFSVNVYTLFFALLSPPAEENVHIWKGIEEKRGNEGSRTNPLAYGATTWGKMLCGDSAVLLVKLSKA